MTKFNRPSQHTILRTPGPVVSEATPSGTTFNGAPGFERNTKSALFLLACSNMVGEDTFYEKASTRDPRFVQLVHQVVAEGDSEWLGRFLPWLRNSANMRSASIVAAVEATVAMGKHGIPGGRQLINSVLARADEPGEALAYYHSHYRRSFPKPLKRGVADAVTRLYTEWAALKYDTASKGLRFGDVLELTHPKPNKLGQDQLFKFLVTRGKGRDPLSIPDGLPMFIANAALRHTSKSTPQMLLNTARLRQAGMTWEDVLSLAGDAVPKKDLWEAIIPEMGYMALLRNLRNFDEADVKGDTVEWVKQKLTSPAEVARSRQLPTRFLSAYREVPSNRWAQPLEEALELSLNSLPTFLGKTLVLVDTSGSMNEALSAKSKLMRWDVATTFGLALARRCHEATVVSFSGTTLEFHLKKGESLLKAIERFKAAYFINGGTNTAEAIRRYASGHDRIVILTDEQADSYQGRLVPPNTRMITFNLAGYRKGHAPSGLDTNLITIGGLSDAAFQLLPALESYGRGQWPF